MRNLADHRQNARVQDLDISHPRGHRFDARDAHHHAVAVHGLLRRSGGMKIVAAMPGMGWSEIRKP